MGYIFFFLIPSLSIVHFLFHILFVFRVPQKNGDKDLMKKLKSLPPLLFYGVSH